MEEKNTDKKSWRKKHTIFCLCLLAIIIILWIVADIANEDDKPDVEAFELDGFTIDTPTEEQIIKLRGHARNYIIENKKSGNRTGVDKWSDFDYDKYYFSARKSNGLMTISSTKATDCILNFSISSTLESGKMKIVIIKDEEILEYIDLNKEVNLSYSVEG